MPKPSATAALADRLVRELAACRDAGGAAYPVRLDRLAAHLDPVPEPASVLDAVVNKAFTARGIVAVKGRPDAPAALREDLSQLATSPLTLEAALLAKAGTSVPPWSLKQLVRVVHKPLRGPFAEALGRLARGGELPPFAVAVTRGKAVALHHRDQQLPATKEAQDAARLVDRLRRWERPGGAVPLVTLAELAAAAGVSPAAAKKAVKEPAFAEAAVLAAYKPVGPLVAFTDDLDGLAGGELLLARLLADRSRADAHAFPAGELVANLGDPLRRAVAAHLDRDDLARDLPAGYGFVSVGAGKRLGRRHFFRLENVRSARGDGGRPDAPARPPADFTAAFDAAFGRLDREQGSNNFVSLVDLRAALLAVPREAFDAGLQQLRRERRYTLTSDERSDGFTPEQRAAAVREEGEFLLHVSRGRS